MKLKPAVPVKEEALRAVQITHDILNDATYLYDWREMPKLHERLHVILAPFSDNVYVGASEKAEKLLEEYNWNARLLITRLREREEELIALANEAGCSAKSEGASTDRSK